MFTEVVSVTRIEGGVADNVIPDRVTCRLNYRFPPDRTVAEAEVRLAELVGDAGAARDHEQVSARPGRDRIADAGATAA